MAKGIKTGGRQKGTPNKTTVQVKQALLEAFDELGGVPSLVTWGMDNPTAFYQLWSKLAPIEAKIEAEHSGDIGLTVQIVRMGEDDVSSS